MHEIKCIHSRKHFSLQDKAHLAHCPTCREKFHKEIGLDRFIEKSIPQAGLDKDALKMIKLELKEILKRMDMKEKNSEGIFKKEGYVRRFFKDFLRDVLDICLSLKAFLVLFLGVCLGVVLSYLF